MLTPLLILVVLALILPLASCYDQDDDQNQRPLWMDDDQEAV